MEVYAGWKLLETKPAPWEHRPPPPPVQGPGGTPHHLPLELVICSKFMVFFCGTMSLTRLSRFITAVG